PQQQSGANVLLPTHFTAQLTGRLREVRNGVATVDYQVTGEFDSGAGEFRTRFSDEFHQNNHVVHSMSGSGVMELDVEKGRILSRSETFNFVLYSASVAPQELGKDPKKIENRAEIASKFTVRLLPPGTRLKTNAVVPDYDTGEQVVAAPDEKD